MLRKLMLSAIATGAVLAAVLPANAAETVRFWYHFDNPETR